MDEDEPYWDGKFSREHLQVERLYYEQPTGQYFFTPDGIGCIWFETREQAMEETGAFGQPIITLGQELSDF
jgi:hypothetical protein